MVKTAATFFAVSRIFNPSLNLREFYHLRLWVTFFQRVTVKAEKRFVRLCHEYNFNLIYVI